MWTLYFCDIYEKVYFSSESIIICITLIRKYNKIILYFKTCIWSIERLLNVYNLNSVGKENHKPHLYCIYGSFVTYILLVMLTQNKLHKEKIHVKWTNYQQSVRPHLITCVSAKAPQYLSVKNIKLDVT